MPPDKMIGTEGYAEEAESLRRQYEAIQLEPIQFDDARRRIRYLFAPVPCRVLDIGAGTGRDAAGFAARRGRIVAVEPTAASCVTALELHSLPLIECVDDRPPQLAQTARRREALDPLMLTAGWMHLDASASGDARGERTGGSGRNNGAATAARPIPARPADIRRDGPKKRSASQPRGDDRDLPATARPRFMLPAGRQPGCLVFAEPNAAYRKL